MHSRSSWGSARCDAKNAICGLNAQTRSAVASTIASQNSQTGSALVSRTVGIRAGSGSRPTHIIDPDAAQPHFSWS